MIYLDQEPSTVLLMQHLGIPHPIKQEPGLCEAIVTVAFHQNHN